MRAWLGIAALTAAIGTLGCNKPQCRQNTVLVTASFDTGTRNAQALQVTLVYNGKTDAAVSVPGPGGKATGTIEVDFPTGYGAGKTLHIDVVAMQSGRAIGSGSADTTLSASCTPVALAVTSGSVVVDGGGVGDMSRIEDMAMPDMLTLPMPVVASKPDLVGFSTSLDGSGSTDPLGKTLTYAWSFASVPAGSTITNTALSAPTAAKTIFSPDLGGVYMVELTVTTSDARTASTMAAVTVPTVPIFYGRTALKGTGYSMGPRAMSSDGTGDHDIGCFYYSDMGLSNADSYMPFIGYAFQPSAITGTPVFVFEQLVGSTPQLWVSSASTNCTSTPAVRVDNNVAADHIPVSPRFSPDGTRIVYVNMPQSNDGSYTLVTVAADGNGPSHTIRSNTGSMTYLGFTPAIWVDNNTVAWVEPDSNTDNPFTIYKAPDANGAGDPANAMRTQVLRCDQGSAAASLYNINQFAITSFGVIAAGSTGFRGALANPPLPAVQLYKLAANDCTTTNAVALAAEPITGLSWDFDISPDGTNILFSSTRGDGIPDSGVASNAPEPQTDIYVVPADGSSAPRKIAGDPLYDDISPRFIAAGRQFTWTRSMRGSDMGGMPSITPAIMIANADGTNVRVLSSTAAAGERVVYTEVGASRGFDCAWTPGAVSAGGSSALVLAMLMFLGIRWRKRR